MVPVPSEPPHAFGLSILIVDDEPRIARSLARLFADHALTVAPPDLVVLDLCLREGENGIELARQLRAIAPATRIVILSGYPSLRSAVAAGRNGVDAFLEKPGSPEEIFAALRNQGIVIPATHLPGNVLERRELETIRNAVAQANGNLSQAARMLGIHRSSLQRKLKKKPRAGRKKKS
jgi:two-component system response regulator RegA